MKQKTILSGLETLLNQVDNGQQVVATDENGYVSDNIMHAFQSNLERVSKNINYNLFIILIHSIIDKKSVYEFKYHQF